MERLRQRAVERLTRAKKRHGVILLSVAFLVVCQLVTNGAMIILLVADNIPEYRAALVVSAFVASLLDIVFLVLVWIIFETVDRIDREADRLQAFMDNVYRRLP